MKKDSKMGDAETKIAGFGVYYEEYDDGCNQVFVTCKGEGGSLALVQDFGGILDGNDEMFQPISDNVLARIQAWAESKGY
jgi:hypothetical protein